MDCHFESAECDRLEHMEGQNFPLSRRRGTTPSGGTGPSGARGGETLIYLILAEGNTYL